MYQRMIAGITVEFSDDGYFNDPGQWTQKLACEFALEEGLRLTEKHLEILEFIRSRWGSGHSLTVRSVSNSGITDVKGFYNLFPGAPMKIAAKLAGVPKPRGCF